MSASDPRGVRNPLGGDAPIRAVLFDLDGTLYDQGPVRRRMAVDLLASLVWKPIGGSRRLRALQAYRRAQEELRGAARGVTESEQIARAAARSGVTEHEVGALVEEWMQQRPLRYLRRYRAAGLDRLLDRLSRLGVRIGVLSDYPARDKLVALGLGDRFDPVLCSTDEGVRAFKPDPAGFLHACAIWRLPPAEVLMVGDRVEVDAAGATAAGMPCVIIGPAHTAPGHPGAHLLMSSLERLSDVLEPVQ